MNGVSPVFSSEHQLIICRIHIHILHIYRNAYKVDEVEVMQNHKVRHRECAFFCIYCIPRAGAAREPGPGCCCSARWCNPWAVIGNLCFRVLTCRMDAGAGRDSTWRRTAAAAAGAGGGGDDDARGRGGMESPVVPLELYDSARAKIEANLRWLFAKAYGIGKVTFVFFCIAAEALNFTESIHWINI